MILMTGATGLCGSAIVNEFVHQRELIRALVRNRAKAGWLEEFPAVEIINGDMSRPDSLRAALHGVDRVLMISGPTPNMVETQCSFIDAARAAGVGHIVKLSGLDARLDSRFRFGRMHMEIEEHLEKSGLAWTHLRPSGFMQVYLREAATIVADGAFYMALGEVKLSPVDTADAAKVAVSLLRGGGNEGLSFDMTGPEALKMADIAERFSQAIGRAVRYMNVSPSERRRILLARGLTQELADALNEQLEERLKGGVESRVNLSTHEKFNVTPTTFAEFARRNSAAFEAKFQRT